MKRILFLLLIIPFTVLLVFILKGNQIFEYDSDGEAINFKNRNIFPFFTKKISDEFPKYKVLDYNISSILFFRRLYVSISSKKKNVIVLKYDICYLTKKEISDLKFSLNKVVQKNRDTAKPEINQ